jgi:hypothetical protein
MWAIDDPLSENVTGSSDDFRWVKDTKGSAVPENQMYRSQNTAWAWAWAWTRTDESCAMLQA